jgi:hypothetical protein
MIDDLAAHVVEVENRAIESREIIEATPHAGRRGRRVGLNSLGAACCEVRAHTPPATVIRSAVLNTAA